LFVLSYVTHPRPHSFPTRRSSDLVARGPRAPSGRALAQGLAGRAALAAVAVAGLVAIGVPLASANALRRSEAAAAAGDTSATRRSEEHTSELQSPYDLVCRLLLEK